MDEPNLAETTLEMEPVVVDDEPETGAAPQRRKVRWPFVLALAAVSVFAFTGAMLMLAGSTPAPKRDGASNSSLSRPASSPPALSVTADEAAVEAPALEVAGGQSGGSSSSGGSGGSSGGSSSASGHKTTTKSESGAFSSTQSGHTSGDSSGHRPRSGGGGGGGGSSPPRMCLPAMC